MIHLSTHLSISYKDILNKKFKKYQEHHLKDEFTFINVDGESHPNCVV